MFKRSLQNYGEQANIYEYLDGLWHLVANYSSIPVRPHYSHVTTFPVHIRKCERGSSPRPVPVLGVFALISAASFKVECIYLNWEVLAQLSSIRCR